MSTLRTFLAVSLLVAAGSAVAHAQRPQGAQPALDDRCGRHAACSWLGPLRPLGVRDGGTGGDQERNREEGAHGGHGYDS